MREEKFYIPTKLNKSASIGIYNIADMFVLFLIAIPTVLLLIGSGNILVLIPLLTYAVLRMKFGERTVGEKLNKIIKHLSKPQIYLLKECIKPDENH